MSALVAGLELGAKELGTQFGIAEWNLLQVVAEEVTSLGTAGNAALDPPAEIHRILSPARAPVHAPFLGLDSGPG